MKNKLMDNRLILETKGAFISVFPITIIVLLLDFTIVPMPFDIRIPFLLGSLLLVIGMGLFTQGAEIAMMPMGEHMGAQLTKSRKIGLLVGVSFVMGTIVTMAEPDLQVLAGQVPSIPALVLILTVSIGVGIFLVISLLRILFQWKISHLLVILYLIIFAISAFAPEAYMAVAFDAGGVTTGPITVPFILALGIGVSAVRGSKSSHDDSFGLLALCSIGPVIAVLVMGIFFDSSILGGTEPVKKKSAETFAEAVQLFTDSIPQYLMEVFCSLLPIILIFLIFQLVYLRLPKSQMIKIAVGIFYTSTGLILFLTGVNVGFLPVGSFIGEQIGSLSYSWVLIPLGMIVGYFIVAAEPAVHVLNTQVEEITGGAVSKSAMLWSLSIGVSFSIGLSLIRVIYGVSIWYFLLPGYLIAMVLTFFVPNIFVAIAFDSGGVASGTMTATFLLPFAMGACIALGGDVMTDAFGIIAMVAMAPLITIQIMGLIYKIKLRHDQEEEEDVIEGIAEEIADELEDEYLDME